MRGLRGLAVVLLALAVIVPVAAQETKAPGTIEGIITDPQQVPLPGATVFVSSANTGFEGVALSGPDGRYKIENVPPGIDYELTVSFSGGGYSKVTQDRIQVASERKTVESVQLFEEMTTTVVVSTKANSDRVVQLEEIGTVTEFDSEFIEGLPLLGRNYQDILTLAAGVSDSDDDGNPNVLGARTENFKTVIDGVSNQDPVGGNFLSNLNSDAIEEVEVVTTGADASFSRASGGFANIITKSGSNDFEGSFTLSFRTSLLDGNGMTGNEEGSFKSVRPAVTLSGALKKDKLWYFFTDEEFRDDIPINTLVGNNTLIREVNGRRFLAKATWQVNSNNKLTAQVRSDPLEFSNLGVNSLTLQEAGFTQEQGGPFFQLELNTVFSPTVLLESRIAKSDTTLDITPNTPQDPTDSRRFESAAFNINLDTNARTGSWFFSQEDKIQRLTFREDLKIFVDDFFGRHDIIGGISLEQEHFERDRFRGTVRFFRIEQDLFGATGGGGGGGQNDVGDGAGRKIQTTENLGVPLRQGGFNQLEGDADTFGIYIQDTWLPRSNLSISAGLRVDHENVTAAGFDPFDPRAENNQYQAFLNECLAPTSEPEQNIRSQELIAAQFPEEYAEWLAVVSQGGNQPVLKCSAARGFFSTFPKERFAEDCRVNVGGQAGGSFCSGNLNLNSQVFSIVGSRQPAPLEITNTNLAPRFSISWDPWNNGKMRFFASFGRFFDKTNLAVATAEQAADLRTRTFTFNTSTNSTPGENAQAGSDPDVTLVDRGLRTEFNDEWTIGFESEIAPDTKIRMQYIARKFRNQLQDVDLNHYIRDVGPEFLAPVRREIGLLGGRQVVGFIPVGGEALCRLDDTVAGLAPIKASNPLVTNNVVALVGNSVTGPNGEPDDCFGATEGGAPIADGIPDLFRNNVFFNNVLFLSNLNFSDFEGFTVEFIRRLRRNWQVTASWTHSRNLGAASNFADESGNDPSLVRDEFGFTNFDIRNQVVVSVITILPWGDLRLGSVMRYFSGTPFSIRETDSSFDSSQQSSLRTTFPTGSRNDQRNEPHMQFDVTLEKGFFIKKYQASAQFLVENLLADDFITIGNLVDGQLLAVRDFGRQYELRFKVNF